MYIKRNAEGIILAVSHDRSDEMFEWISDESAELQKFLVSIKTPQHLALEQTDLAMARVLEDVINLLVEQGTIRFTDLPIAAQTKLSSRRELRGQRHGMNLLDDGDDLKI